MIHAPWPPSSSSGGAHPPGAPLPLGDVGALIPALDALAASGDAPAIPAAEGRVLRLQLGYNPNSSSLGTSVVMLLWGMGIATVLLQAAAATLLARAASPAGAPLREGDGT